MDLKNRLIEPDENSTTRFEPFYQITPKELDEINRQYHAEQLRLHVVSQRSELLSEDYENKLEKGVKELKEAMKKQGIKLP